MLSPINVNMLWQLKNNYYLAKAMYETTKSMAYEIQAKVLEENAFFEVPEGAEPKRILDPNLVYHMDLEEDFQRYLDLVYPEYVKAGIADPRGREYVPEAEEKETLQKAEDALIQFAVRIMPDQHVSKDTVLKAMTNAKQRETLLDLVLRLEI